MSTLLEEIKIYPLGSMEAPYKEDKWCYAVELPLGKTHAETRNIIGIASKFQFQEQIADIIGNFVCATGDDYNITLSNGHILLTDRHNFKSPFNVFAPQDPETTLHVVTAFYVAADKIKDRLLAYNKTHTLKSTTITIDVYEVVNEPERGQAYV